MTGTHKLSAPEPPCRRLRVFAFDPSLSRYFDTAAVNEITVNLPWKYPLPAGPVDEYLEVVDVDPASQMAYVPVYLDDPLLLAQDGLAPSESNPQFHQQMVYAVARTTIGHFEEALGRRALWAPRSWKENRSIHYEPVDRLRIYPHALREANAYYSPTKKALLFGYFPASGQDPGNILPGSTVFTCLSYDIIAHETTHALLDGLHQRFIEPSNLDALALHEAFADIVALFQHFSHPDALRQQIARTRGRLDRQNLLAQMAHEFGQAIGRYGALRDALGSTDPDTRTWTPQEPNPLCIRRTTEPHDRGAILVAAVFEAFLTIYERRIADLLRIATGGSGELPVGELHPDLVERLAKEAAKTAGQILHMCIRALDYCPPVDVSFGDYLRALITADKDYAADDQWNYRLAIIEAFRRRGIYPHSVRNLSEESLLWQGPGEREDQVFGELFGGPGALRNLAPDWGLATEVKEVYENCKRAQGVLHEWILQGHERTLDCPFVVLENEPPNRRAYYGGKQGRPAFEVHSVRPARRTAINGQTTTDLVVEITQRRRGYFDLAQQKEEDGKERGWNTPDFIFRGGCTLLIDLETAKVRYCIYKRVSHEGDDRLERQRQFLLGQSDLSLQGGYALPFPQMYYRKLVDALENDDVFDLEPFALLQRGYDPREMRK